MQLTTTTSSPSRWRWLVALLVGVAGWYLASILGVIALSLLTDGPQNLQGPLLAPYAVVRLVAAAIFIALSLLFVGLRLSDLGLTREGWRGDVVIGLVLGTLQPVLQFALLIPLTGGAERSDVIASRALIGDTILGLLAAIVLGWLVGGVAEELFYRGFLITGLRHFLGNRAWSVGVAVLVSTLYFAAAHTYQGWIGWLDTGVAGLIWAGLYLWRGRLTAGIVAHGLNDMLLLIGLYLWY